MVSNFVFFLKKHTFILWRLFKYLSKFSSAIFMNSSPIFKHFIHLAFGKFWNLTFFFFFPSNGKSPNYLHVFVFFLDFYILFYVVYLTIMLMIM